MTTQEKDAATFRRLSSLGFTSDDLAQVFKFGWTVEELSAYVEAFLKSAPTSEAHIRHDFEIAYPELFTQKGIQSCENEDAFSSFGFYSVPDLSEEERKPIEFIVDGMIPVGMTFISGAPKTRKSFFALQMGIAVARGEPFFGFTTVKADVVYLDLEGSKRRISARTQNMSSQIPRNLYLSHTVPEKLSDGLVERLRMLHRQRPSIRFIIIDTYSRARGRPKSFGQNAYDADVDFLEPVQRMAVDEGIAVLFVHHDRKGAANVSDSFERLSGTMGISGSADSVLNLIADGKRFDGKAKLEWTPRDAEGGELNLVFDKCCTEWQRYDQPVVDIRGNPICRWVIDNCPEPKFDGQFFTYSDVFKGAYHCFSDSPSDKVREQLNSHKKDLFEDYGIAVQMGVKSHGERGIRLFSVK